MQILTDSKKIDFKKLESFIYSYPNANFFQTTKAYDFFCGINNYEPIFLVAEKNNEIIGSLLAVIIREGTGIKGFLSRRCIVWGGPLFLADDVDTLNSLVAELSEIVKTKAIYTEFRNLTDLTSYQQVFFNNGFVFYEHLNFIVTITSYDQAKANLSKSKKRQINKSLKNGAEIVEAENLDQVKEFYQLLKKLYKEKVGKPLPDLDFFERFFQSGDLGKYLLIKTEGEIIGGIMCPVYKDTIYEWYVCGIDDRYDNIYPSVLATWAPIEYAANDGLKYFDFMGAGKPDQDYGVREFKSKFGGDLVNYGRYIRINKPLLYKLGKTALSAYKKFSK